MSVKPHASPVLHAINYLLGELPAQYLDDPARVRRPAELPEPREGPGPGRLLHRLGRHRRDRADLGCAGPPLRRRRLGRRRHGPAVLAASATPSWTRAPAGRRSSTRWSASWARWSGSSTSTGSALDRVVPNIGATRLQGMFAAAGWQVLTVKYGRLLQELFARPGGEALRRRIDEMSNPEYQRLLRCTAAQLRERLPGDAETMRRGLRALVDALDDATLRAGHPQPRRPRPRRPGRGLRRHRRHPPDGDLRLHRQGLRPGHRGPPAEPLVAADRRRSSPSSPSGSGPTPTTRGRAFADGSPEAALCAETAARLRRAPVPAAAPPAVPADLGRTPSGTATTQAALGRTLLDLTRAAPDAAAPGRHRQPRTSARRPTSAAGSTRSACGPPASGSTGSPTTPRRSCTGARRPTGQHLELGIAETNLVGLLGELGATWSRWGQPLLPIGVLYDPFVERALEPWSFGIYAGGQSILVGTPSGVTPRAGGRCPPVDHDAVDRPGAAGLHQLRAGVRDRRGVDAAGRARPARPARTARRPTCGCPPGRSTRRWPPCPTTPPRASGAAARWSPAPTRCAVPRRRPRSRSPRWARPSPRRWPPPTGWPTLGHRRRRRLRDQPRPALPTPAGASAGAARGESWILDAAFPAPGGPTPLVTVLDGHPHTLAFLAGVHGVRGRAPGRHAVRAVRRPRVDVYRYHGLDTDSVVAAALDLL